MAVLSIYFLLSLHQDLDVGSIYCSHLLNIEVLEEEPKIHLLNFDSRIYNKCIKFAYKIDEKIDDEKYYKKCDEIEKLYNSKLSLLFTLFFNQSGYNTIVEQINQENQATQSSNGYPQNLKLSSKHGFNISEFEELFNKLILLVDKNKLNKIEVISALLQSAFTDPTLFTSFMVIILEALFVDNEKAESTYKFKMRQSYFFNKLGKGTSDSKVINDWYGLRSSVLHGSKKYDDPKLFTKSTLHETNKLIFENVKLAIFEYIKGNLDPKKIDEEMVK